MCSCPLNYFNVLMIDFNIYKINNFPVNTQYIPVGRAGISFAHVHSILKGTIWCILV